jgi:hypothetical protein
VHRGLYPADGAGSLLPAATRDGGGAGHTIPRLPALTPRRGAHRSRPNLCPSLTVPSPVGAFVVGGDARAARCTPKSLLRLAQSLPFPPRGLPARLRHLFPPG